MGWDTYFSISDRLFQSWRKHAPSHPRLLFEDADLLLVEPSEKTECIVRYVTTAGQARRSLDNRGITWELCVRDYRESGVAAGFLVGSVMGRLEEQVESGALTPRQMQDQLASIQSGDASQELRDLGALLVANWQERPEDEGCIVHSWLEHSWAADDPGWADCIDVLHIAQGRGLQNAHGVAKASEYLCRLWVDAPTLAWLVVMRLVLEALPPETAVELDLSDDAARQLREGHVSDVRSYAADYWKEAAVDLAGQATFYARLYRALAGAASTTGPEYARARARALLSDCLQASARGKAKGDMLEDLLEAVIEISQPDLAVVERNLRTRDEELDLVVTNHLRDTFWVALSSPAFFLECKNWHGKVGVDELRVFETKLADHASLCKLGIFVAFHGYTEPFARRLREMQSHGRTVFALTAADLAEAIEHPEGLPGWIVQHGVRRVLSSRGSSKSKRAARGSDPLSQ